MTETAPMLLAALLAGLAGSAHCLAMCGGMAGLLAAHSDDSGRPLRRTLAYNLGRIASYTLGGLVAGLLGAVIGSTAGFVTATGYVRAISGTLIVLAGLYLLTGKRFFAPFERLGDRAWQRIAPLAVRQLRAGGGAFVLGMLWGWLPCGMTWSMLAVAAATFAPLQGASIMLAFGVGTLPALLAAGLAGLRLRGLFERLALRRAAGMILLVAGLWTAVVPLSMPAQDGKAGVRATHHGHRH